MVLRPWSQVIAAYLALGLGGRAPSTKGTYRSVLRHLAEVDAPKAAPRFAGSLAPSPYGAGERAELYSIASSQRRPWRVHSALVLLAFGLGAGLCGGGHRRPTLAPKGGHQAPLLRALGPLAPRAGSRGPGHHQDVPARPPKVCTQSAVTIAPDIARISPLGHPSGAGHAPPTATPLRAPMGMSKTPRMRRSANLDAEGCAASPPRASSSVCSSWPPTSARSPPSGISPPPVMGQRSLHEPGGGA